MIFEGTSVCLPFAPLVAFLTLARGCLTIRSMLRRETEVTCGLLKA